MKKAQLILLLVLALAILLTACADSSASGSDPTQTTKPSTSETEEESKETEATTTTTEKTTEAPEPTTFTTEQVTEAPEPTVSIVEKVMITADYASDEILSSYDSFSEFIESEDISQRIIFTTNVGVKSFSFIEVIYKEKDGEFAFFENGVLYSIEDFSPEKPFLVSWMETGAIPNRGISFVDESDTTRYFYLASSGEDGSLILAEFQNE
ncbi:MAG: hypothetical protein GXY99_03745 [Clostridiaceae bacterium]|jgi:hypothetical protein|nr:hypothetical protein [Clostridiaceae bacterium]HZJ90355.1 hypothetical protein [Oscillospiraceae bacterium]